MSDNRHELTQLLLAADSPAAIDSMLPLVYDELRRMASARIAAARPGQTLQATALVHEAYLKLSAGQDVPWQNRAHFFGAAARAMRNILVDRARQRGAQKRGGGSRGLTLDTCDVAADSANDYALLVLDDALRRLESEDTRKYQVVMLRYFTGLTIEQTAQTLGLAGATVERDWAFARAWMRREMEKAGVSAEDSGA